MDTCVLHLCGLKRYLLLFLPTTHEEPCHQDHGNHADSDPTFLSDLFHILCFYCLRFTVYGLQMITSAAEQSPVISSVNCKL